MREGRVKVGGVGSRLYLLTKQDFTTVRNISASPPKDDQHYCNSTVHTLIDPHSMPSKSTNLNRVQPEKRKRDDAEDSGSALTSEPATKKKLTGAEKKRQKKQRDQAEKAREEAKAAAIAAAVAMAPPVVAPVETEEVSIGEEQEQDDEAASGEAEVSNAPAGEALAEENEEDVEEDEDEDEEDDEDESSEPTPTKEDIEADTTLKEGARLALLYATLYLKFNPSPIYRPITAPPKKSMKSAHPLPLDPYAAVQSGNLFQSDYTPAEAKFELTAKQYAQKKKQERLGKAKKGDGVSSERWTFNKARESWLIRRVCDDVQLPSKYFPIALAYLSSVKAPNARADLTGTAKDALKVEGEQAKRGKRVIKMLRSSASSNSN